MRQDRVFLDANVLFSAAWAPESVVHGFWRFPIDQVALVTSEYAIDEARRNLPANRHAQLDELLKDVDIVPTAEDTDVPVSADAPLVPKDLPILQAAIAAGASHLITGDKKHFGALFERIVAGVLILQPSEYLATAPIDAPAESE